MYIDKENFEAWMERIMDRLDMQDKKIDRLRHAGQKDRPPAEQPELLGR